MYPQMDILDAEPDGDNDEELYDKDDLDLHDVNHPNYMPPHVQAYENELLEAGIYAKHVPKQEKIVHFQVEIALLATMFDSNTELKSFHETKQTQDSTNWWAAMTTDFQDMEQKKVSEALHKTSIPVPRKVIGARWVYAKKADR
jgi:hypothetical protein